MSEIEVSTGDGKEGESGTAQESSVPPPVKVLQCDMCHKTFFKMHSLTRHMTTHQRQSPRQKQQQRDSRLRPKPQPITNGMPLQSRNTDRILKTHEHVEYSVKVTCLVCDWSCSNRNALIDHMMSTHACEEYQCAPCGRVFRLEAKLKKHIESSHSQTKDNGVKEEDNENDGDQNDVEEMKTGTTENDCDPDPKDRNWPKETETRQTDKKKILKRNLVQEEDGMSEICTEFPLKTEPSDFCEEGSRLVPLEVQKAEPLEQHQEMNSDSERGDYDDVTEVEDFVEQVDEIGKLEAVDYSCDQCGQVFQTKSGCDRHRKYTHLSTTGSEKNDHHQSLTEKVDLNHSGLDLKHTILHCNPCQAQFNTQQELKEHRKTLHPDAEQFACFKCVLWFSTREQVKKHWSRTHKPKRRAARAVGGDLECETCKRRITRGLEAHRKICTPETFIGDGYRCPYCDRILKTYTKFYYHRAIHIKRFKCTECGEAFGSKGQLQIHMAKHGAEKPFMCHICSKCFILREILRKHMEIHGDRERTHVCEECGSGFYSEKMLKEHIKNTHRGHRNIMCEVCGACIRGKKAMRDHMNRHTGEKPYKCALCSAAFAQNNNLKRHQWVHTKLKPFKCDECGKSFPFKPNLKRHMLLHTGEKPFHCDRCEMSFNQKSSLNTHMRLHNDEKPHQCTMCEKAFNHKVCLVKHSKNHHGAVQQGDALKPPQKLVPTVERLEQRTSESNHFENPICSSATFDPS